MLRATTDRSHEVLDAISVLVFAAVIGVPGAYHLAVGDEPARQTVRLTEWREPAPLPELTAKTVGDFPKGFESYLNDSFASRPFLARHYNRLKVLGLGESPIPSLVLGKEGWIYTAADQVLDSSRGAAILEDGALNAWRDTLEGNQRELKARMINYVVALAPNKHSIYPEYLPDAYAPVGPSNTDVFLNSLAGSAVVPVDLRGPVLEAKLTEQVCYHPLGTHWNERGAYAAYRRLAKALGLEPIGRDRIAFVPSQELGDNWAVKLQLDDVLTQEVEHAVLLEPWAARDAGSRLEASWLTTQRDGDLQRVLVFHDSFGITVQKWISEHYSEAVYVDRKSVDFDLVDRVRPDVVLHLICERFLIYWPDAIPGQQ